MKPFLKDLINYSHHFNQKICDVLIDYPDKTSEKALKVFNHVLNAQHVWNNRIDPQQPPFGVWEMHDTQYLKRIDQTNYEHSIQILERFDLTHIIHYQNSKGESFSNSILDILFHMINHSTHHRGQLATEFKQHGMEPLVMDYILYKR